MNKIKELFISRELAIKAVEFGFDEPVIGYFDKETDNLYPSIQEVNTLIEAFRDDKDKYKNYESDDSVFIDYNGYKSFPQHEYPAITYDQIVIWLRNNYKIHITIDEGFDHYKGLFWVEYNFNDELIEYIKWFETYEEAKNKGLTRAFEIIKNK